MPKIKLEHVSFFYIALLFLSATPHLFELLCAIILHEVGHLIFAFILKLKIKAISLSLLGARIETDSELSYGEEFLFALGGPLFSFLGFALTMPWALKNESSPLSQKFLLPFALICACLLIFNLLPLHSLDGGRMLSSFAFSVFSFSSASKIMRALNFLTLLSLWLFSVYMILRISQGLPMFVFCIIFFVKCFILGDKNGDLERI